MNSSIWEHFASGSFSPGTSPAFLSGPGAAELARLRQELDEANGTIKQWEESWKQARQVLAPPTRLSRGLWHLAQARLTQSGHRGWGRPGVLGNRAETPFGLFFPPVEKLALPVRTLGWLVSQAWNSLCELLIWSGPIALLASAQKP